jgi:hypothetical protein
MKGCIFHANQIYVERETGAEPATRCSEEVTAPTSFCSPFEPEKREGNASFRYYSREGFSLAPAICLIDFTILA